MKAEAIALPTGSSVSALNQTRVAGGDQMGGDFLMALLAAMMPPLGIDTHVAGMELLEQQTKSPEGGEVINVFPGVNVVAENGGNAVLPDFTMILSGGPTTESREELNSIVEELNPVVIEEYRQAVLAAEVGLTPGNPVNSFGQDKHFASPATDSLATDYSKVDRMTVPVQQVSIPEGVNFGVSETAVGSEAVTQSLPSGSEGGMKAAAQEFTIPLTQSQVDRVDQVMSPKEGKTQIPEYVTSAQSAGQGQIPYRPQSPVGVSWSPVVPGTVETPNIPVQIAMVEDAGILTREAETANVGSSREGLADTGETKWQNISAKSDGEGVVGVRVSSPGSKYSGQNPGDQGEKEKVMINAGQDHKRVTDASTFMQEDRQWNAVPAQNSGMAVKQADSVIVTDGKPPLTEVFGNQGVREKSEEKVSPGEKAQGVRAENMEPGPGQEQTQVNSGTVNMSNITPRKFPSEILPHLMNPIRSINADGQVTVIRLKLEPENMGEIKIRISYAKGKMAAHFYTSSGLVREAIECSLPQLKETLAQYKVDLGEATASLGQEQQNNGFGSTGFGHNGRMKGFSGMFSGGDLGEKPTLAGMGDDQRVNLLI